MAAVSAQVTVIVPVSQLENEIIRLNSEGFTVVKGEVIDKNIRLFANRIFIQRWDDDDSGESGCSAYGDV